MRAGILSVCVGMAMASSLLFACQPKMCTLKGCEENIRVEMELPEGTVESVEGEVRVGNELHTFACPGDSPLDTVFCHRSTLFIDMREVGQPKEVRLDVLVNEGRYAYKGKIRPAYTSVELNGPGCGDCDYGDAAIELVRVDE